MKFIFKTQDQSEIYMNRFSGPYSFYLLTPSRLLTADQYDGISQMKKHPSIILLGDHHTDSRHQCANCTCDSTLTKCCFTIFKDQFFQLLNECVVQTGSKVCVYLESMDKQYTKQDLIYSNQDLFDASMHAFEINRKTALGDDIINGLEKLKYNFRNCFDSITKKQYNEIYQHICQAPNLNWTFADPRAINIWDSEEHFKLESLIKNVWSIDLFGCLFAPKFKGSLSSQFINQKLIEQRLQVFFHQSIDEVKSFCTIMQYLYDFDKADLFVDYLFDEEQNHVSKYSMILKYNRTKEWKELYKSVFVIKNIQEFLYERINVQLNKPYNKTHTKKWSSFQDNIKQIAKKFSVLFQLVSEFIDDKSMYNQLQQHIESLYPYFDEHKFLSTVYSINSEDIDNFTTFYKNVSLNSVHTMITSCFLDLYVLVKVLRHDDTDMMILYAGEEHCKFLFEVFYKYFGYNTNIRIPNQIDSQNNPIQCIDLSKISYHKDIDVQDYLLHKY